MRMNVSTTSKKGLTSQESLINILICDSLKPLPVVAFRRLKIYSSTAFFLFQGTMGNVLQNIK